MPTFQIGPGNTPAEVACGGEITGAVVSNRSTVTTVYYSRASTVSNAAGSFEGSLGPGVSTTLYGAQFFFVPFLASPGTRSSRAFVDVIPISAAASTIDYPLELMPFGHSFVDGAGATSLSKRFSSMLATALGRRERNVGISGGQMLYDTTSQLYTLSSAVMSTFGQTLSSSLPTVTNMVAHFAGVNDLASLGATSSSRIGVVALLREELHRLRASMFSLYTDWTFAQGTGGTAPATTTQTAWPAGSLGWIKAVGNTMTVPIPSYFPGGSVTLWNATNFGNGATYSITVDGVAYGTFSSLGLLTFASAKSTPFPCTVTNLAPGAHSIVLTCTALTGNDFWSHFTVPSLDPPSIAVANIPRAPAYPSVVTTANVQGYNPEMAAMILAEFTDGRVTIVDADAILQYDNVSNKNFDTVGYGAGGVVGGATALVHPSNEGHAKLVYGVPGVPGFYQALTSMPQQTVDTAVRSLTRLQSDISLLPQVPNSGRYAVIKDVTLNGAGSGTLTTRALVTVNCAVLTQVLGATAGSTAVGTITPNNAFTDGFVTITGPNSAVVRCFVVNSA